MTRPLITRPGTGIALFATALAAIVLSALVVSNAFAATLFNDDFEDGNITGWTTSGGSWTVNADDSRVLGQHGTSADARARAGSTAWTDYVVSARVKPLAFNGTNRFVAITARTQGNTNAYALALTGADTVDLKRRVGGAWTTLSTTPLTVAIGSWYTLALQVAGSSLTGSVNGAQVVSATDGQFTSGQIGLVTSYASASFDDVSVVDGPGGGPSPTTSATVSPSVSPSASQSPGPPPPPGTADGFASVNALGQNGTTGGAGGPVLTATTAAQLLDYIKRPGPQVIEVAGTIQLTRMEWVTSDKTVVGLGSTATINGGGLTVKNEKNVIIRNLSFTNSKDDGINIDDDAHHIWVDHNSFFNAFDGALDIRLGATYITASWNHFDRQDKNMLLGAADTNGGTDIGKLRVTYHHNFFDHTHQRNPRVRFGEPVHVYNNYFFDVSTYGVASTMDAGVLVEGNYFENVPETILSGYMDSGPGRVVERNNVYVNSGQPHTLGTVVEPSTFYPYQVDDPTTVPQVVRAGAGVGKL